MKLKHTPGPWNRDKYGDIVNPAGQRVHFQGVSTLMSSSEERMAEAGANTTLLIAAPQMYELLRAAYDQYCDDPNMLALDRTMGEIGELLDQLERGK